MLISVKTTRSAMSQYQYQVYSQGTAVNILVLCCSNKKLLIYDQMTNYRRKKTFCFRNMLWLPVCECLPDGSPKTLSNQYDHTDQHADDGGLFCYWKNMGHFCKLFLILFSPLVNPQFHQWLAGMADRRRWAWASVENYHLCNHGSFKRFPLFTAAFRAFPNCQMHFSKWNNNFNQNKSIFVGGGERRKSITVLLTF